MEQIAGIRVERTSAGVPKFVRIDLRKHADFIPLLEKKGVEMEEPIKWTAKMKRSFAQAKNGEVYVRNLEDILDTGTYKKRPHRLRNRAGKQLQYA